MSDFMVQATLSNVLVSAVLAVIAWLVQRKFPSHSLRKLIWSVVLVKMITPPLFQLPLITLPSTASPTQLAHQPPLGYDHHAFDAVENHLSPETSVAFASPRSQAPWLPFPPEQLFSIGTTALLCLWLLTSMALAFVSLLRIGRFHFWLKASSQDDTVLSQKIATLPSKKMGVSRRPSIWVTTANLAPFVWWDSGRVIVVLSRKLIDRLSEYELQLVVSHELAHIRRGDHWFRFLEWACVIGFFWNPVLWWTRSNLRKAEEMACDRLVLDSVSCPPGDYVNMLLSVAEFLSDSPTRPPILASAVNGGGTFERRLHMIVRQPQTRVTNSLCWSLLLLVLGLFPLGIVTAQDYEAIKRRLGSAVKEGEITEKQASVMLEALAKTTDKSKTSSSESEAKKQRYMNLAKEIELAIKDGKISEEEGKKKLSLAREKMFASDKAQKNPKEQGQPSVEARKKRFGQLEEKLRAAVKAGDLTEAEAKEQLQIARSKMFGEGREKPATSNPKAGAQREQFAKMAQQIEAAVKEGKITKEQAQEKLAQLKKQMTQGQAKPAPEKTQKPKAGAQREQFAKMAQQIEAAVKEGKITKEQAQEKLAQLKKQMAEGKRGSESKPTAANNLEARKKRFAALEARVKEAVESGKITKKEGEQRLNAVRKQMFEKDQ